MGEAGGCQREAPTEPEAGEDQDTEQDEPWLDKNAAWIERNWQLQKKDLSEKWAKLLEEMNQKLSISSLVEEFE